MPDVQKGCHSGVVLSWVLQGGSYLPRPSVNFTCGEGDKSALTYTSLNPSPQPP